MNIKKVDDKPMGIHTKEKPKVHLKGAPEQKSRTGISLPYSMARRLPEVWQQTGRLVYFDGRIVAGKTGKPGECIQIHVADVQEWCPENPALYEVIVRLMSTSKNILDEIKSYTAFRKISLMNKNGMQKIALNDQEIFQMGVLDQGYWPDGIYTPPSDAAQAWEIAEMKKLGFNMIRKHAKVENYRWYYWCDYYGMLVWQDMPSSFATGGTFNTDADNDQEYSRVEENRKQFQIELEKMIMTHKNIPCIIIWTIFNEGWGEFDTIKMTEFAMSLDRSRLFISNSGYNCSEDIEIGDIKDIHNYLPPKAPTPSETRAIVCGEFGSLGSVCTGHMYHEYGPYHGLYCSDFIESSERSEADTMPFLDEFARQGADFLQSIHT